MENENTKRPRCTCPDLLNGHYPGCPFLLNKDAEHLCAADSEPESDLELEYADHVDEDYFGDDFDEDEGDLDLESGEDWEDSYPEYEPENDPFGKD